MGSLQPIRASVRQLVLKPPEPSESRRQKTSANRPRAEKRKILSANPLLECNRVGKRPVVAFRATPAPHAGDRRKDMGKWTSKVCIPFTMAKIKYFDPGLRQEGVSLTPHLSGK